MAERPQVEERRAVSAAIRRRNGLWLAVRRPDEADEELPGVWGLPATTLRDGETPEDGLRRLGSEKLGVELTPLRRLGEGEQRRAGYTLRIAVYEASTAGEPRLPERATDASGTLYEALDWLPGKSFREAASRGSLCCRVFLETLGENKEPVDTP